MGTQKRLLMIDDDPDFVEVVAKVLVDAGYEVDAKYNPDEGFNALKTGDYDLLLLDVLMGRGAEGIMIARKIGDDPVLRERSRHRIAVGDADSLVEDVGLHDEAVPDFVLLAAVLAYGDDRQCGLVRGDDRVVGQIAAVQAGVVAAQFDYLGIGEAQTSRVNPSQQLVSAWRADLCILWRSVFAQCLQADAIEVPHDLLFGQLLLARPILLK